MPSCSKSKMTEQFVKRQSQPGGSKLFYFIIENVHLYFLEESQNLIGLFVFSPEGASGITRLVRALCLLTEL